MAASVDGHPNVVGAMRRLSYLTLHQDGDCGEATFLFDAADFTKVAKLMRPYRRPRLSAEQRARLAERVRANFGHSAAQKEGLAAQESRARV